MPATATLEELSRQVGPQQRLAYKHITTTAPKDTLKALSKYSQGKHLEKVGHGVEDGDTLKALSKYSQGKHLEKVGHGVEDGVGGDRDRMQVEQLWQT